MSTNSPRHNGDPADRLYRLAIKIPAFWKNDPELWFRQVEAQFNLANITSDPTRFSYVVANLEGDVISHVADFIKEPPQQDKYQALRQRLVEQFGATADEKLDTFLRGFELGDMKPSQLLCKMKSVVSGLAIDESLVRNRFLKSLPPHAQTILRVSGELDSLDELARHADLILAVPFVPVQTSVSQVEQLQGQVEAMTQEIEKLRAGIPTKPPTSRQKESRRMVCWFHTRFGNKARKCEPPCSFHEGNERSGRM